MLAQAQKRQEKYEKEILRIEALKVYERKYADYALICGIDEVGRGPLAGPVVAGAVILPKDCNILYINDSKKLSEKKREELYDVIMERAVATGIGMASPARIDEINILQATYEAMREAISKLDPQPDLLLNDAVTIPQVEIHQVPIIKGDAKSISIGAASIIAKVTRDRLMVEYDKVMPEYGFASNKGYGSAAHIDALKKYGFGCIFILPDGRIYTEYGNGDNPDSLKQRNVSGEMLGAMYAVRFALNSGFTVIEIRYDYEGIEKWVTGAWKSKNDLTKKYAQTMLGWGQKIQIRFTKVPAHSKVKYNELADETAKLGVANGNGIPKVKSLSDFEAADGVEA